MCLSAPDASHQLESFAAIAIHSQIYQCLAADACSDSFVSGSCSSLIRFAAVDYCDSALFFTMMAFLRPTKLLLKPTTYFEPWPLHASYSDFTGSSYQFL